MDGKTIELAEERTELFLQRLKDPKVSLPRPAVEDLFLGCANQRFLGVELPKSHGPDLFVEGRSLAADYRHFVALPRHQLGVLADHTFYPPNHRPGSIVDDRNFHYPSGLRGVNDQTVLPSLAQSRI